MMNEANQVDPRVAEALRRTEPLPLGLTSRLEAGLSRRAREAERLTTVEQICVVAVWGLVGAVGGPVGVGVALLAGFVYGRVTILVEA